jgi:hypothetical protein
MTCPPPETFACHSIENLLDAGELTAVRGAMQRALSAASPEQTEVGVRSRSVHSIDGLTPRQAAAVFEPHGRIEYEDVPDEVARTLGQAVQRRWADIVRVYPSARALDPWIYVEYGTDQYITPHIDEYHNDSRPAHPKVAGISLLLNDDVEGGSLFIETCGAAELLVGGEAGTVRSAANQHSDWFRLLPRTQWVSRPRAGTAVLYGSQLTHGTEPVIRGRAMKLISFLTR